MSKLEKFDLGQLKQLTIWNRGRTVNGQTIRVSKIKSKSFIGACHEM
jgi:hypothetical protein